MDIRTTYASLYSGGGGLDLGFELGLRGAVPVLRVERDAAAAAVLVSHMETGRLAPCPLWSDSGTLDGKPWRGLVDWIIGGFPCQPWSVAGAQEGTEDDRWLWPHIRRIARDMEPRGLFLENVPGIFLGGIQPVLGELAEDGYDAVWTTVRASDVGASHRRQRVFILAYRDQQLRQVGIEEVRPGWDAFVSGGRELADAERAGSRDSGGSHEGWRTDAPGTESVRADGSTAATKPQQRGSELADGDSEPGDSIEPPQGVQEPGRDVGDVGHPGHDARSSEQREPQDSSGSSEAARTGQSSRVDDEGLAHASDDNRGSREPAEETRTRQAGLRRGRSSGGDRTVAVTGHGRGWQDDEGVSASGRERAGEPVGDVVDPVGERGRVGQAGSQHAADAVPPVTNHDGGAFPPGPAERERWAYILERWPELAPAVGKSTEQRLSQRDGQRVPTAGTRDAESERPGGRVGKETPQSTLRGVAHGDGDGLARSDQLRILGNGVVPLQAAVAFRTLVTQARRL